jgi:hypothetical protein
VLVLFCIILLTPRKKRVQIPSFKAKTKQLKKEFYTMEPMVNAPVRIPKSNLDRIEKLIPHVTRDSFPLKPKGKGDIIRMVIEMGLAALEEKYEIEDTADQL